MDGFDSEFSSTHANIDQQLKPPPAGLVQPCQHSQNLLTRNI